MDKLKKPRKPRKPANIGKNAVINSLCSFFSTITYHLINSSLKTVKLNDRLAVKMLNSGLQSVFRTKLRKKINQSFG